MRPKLISLVLAPTTDADAIAATQTVTATAGASLSLNGVIGTGALDTNGNARQVSITSGGNDSALTISVVGKVLKKGRAITETLAGGNAGAVNTVNHFFSVSSISTSGATASGIQAGINAVGSSPPYVLDYHQKPFEIGLQASVSATTGSFSVQQTNHKLFDPDAIPVWANHATMASMTAAQTGSLMFPCTGIRLKNDSGAATGTLRVVQSGPF